MDELTPRSRALLARARAAREPTPDDKARIQSRLFAAVAAGAGAAAAGGAGGAAGGAASSGGGAAAGAASSGGGTTGGAASGGGSIGGAAASKGMVGGSVAGTTSAAGSVLSAGAGAAAVGAVATAAAAGGGGWVAGVVVALTIGGLAAGGVGLHLAQSDDPEAETQRGDLASPIGARDEEPVTGTATERRGGDDGALPVSRDGRGPGSGGAGRTGGGTAERAPARPASESPPPAFGVDPLAPGPTSDRSGAGGVDDLDAARDEDATIGEREHGRGGASSSGAAPGFRGHIGAPTKARRSGPAGARSAPPREAAHSDLAAQVALLRDADAELQAGQAVRALALLRVHAHRFPDSQLWAERDATRILALCALGRADEARRRARDWMARAGASPLRASIRSSCAYR